jgi:hypothetical protein
MLPDDMQHFPGDREGVNGEVLTHLFLPVIGRFTGVSQVTQALPQVTTGASRHALF